EGGVASPAMDYQDGEPPRQNAIAGGPRVVARAGPGAILPQDHREEGQSHETVTAPADRRRRGRRSPRRIGGSALVPRGRLPRGSAAGRRVPSRGGPVAARGRRERPLWVRPHGLSPPGGARSTSLRAGRSQGPPAAHAGPRHRPDRGRRGGAVVLHARPRRGPP